MKKEYDLMPHPFASGLCLATRLNCIQSFAGEADIARTTAMHQQQSGAVLATTSEISATFCVS